MAAFPSRTHLNFRRKDLLKKIIGIVVLKNVVSLPTTVSELKSPTLMIVGKP
jgi:hypothetical protein